MCQNELDFRQQKEFLNFYTYRNGDFEAFLIICGEGVRMVNSNLDRSNENNEITLTRKFGVSTQSRSFDVHAGTPCEGIHSFINLIRI